MSFIQQMSVEHLLADAVLVMEDMERTGPTRSFLLRSPASREENSYIMDQFLNFQLLCFPLKINVYIQYGNFVSEIESCDCQRMSHPVAFLDLKKHSNIFIYNQVKCFEGAVNGFLSMCDGDLTGFGKASPRKRPFILSFEGQMEFFGRKGVVTYCGELSSQRDECVTSFQG